MTTYWEFGFATWCALHLLNAAYLLPQTLVGYFGGATIEAVGIGTNLFFKPLQLRFGRTDWRFGLVPLNAYTKFFGASADNDPATEEHIKQNNLEHAVRFDDLPLAVRFLVLLSGPLSVLVVGIFLFCVPVTEGWPQVSVSADNPQMLAPTSVPMLGLADTPATIAGQVKLIRNTYFEFAYRFVTLSPLEGWGGPLSWIFSCAVAGAIAPTSWVSCIAVMCVAQGTLSLLPIPGLNGWPLARMILAILIGGSTSSGTDRAVTFGVLILLLIVILLLYRDLNWFLSIL